jgi:hypothetical protein
MPGAAAVESDLGNNVAEVPLLTMPQAVVLDDLHVYPNPVEIPAAAVLAFDIYHPSGDFDGIMEIWMYDLVGRRVGYGRLERSHMLQQLVIGENAQSLDRFLTGSKQLAPGLYLCVVELRVIGSPASFRSSFRFAVAR